MAIGAVGAYSFFHFEKLPIESAERIEAEIGNLSTAQEGVRYRIGSSLAWQDVAAGKTKEIKVKDAVFTATNTRASVRFKDGTELEIEPSSLVIFTAERPSATLANPRVLSFRLEKGSVRIRALPAHSRVPILVQSSGRLFTILPEALGASPESATFVVTKPSELDAPPQVVNESGKALLLAEVPQADVAQPAVTSTEEVKPPELLEPVLPGPMKAVPEEIDSAIIDRPIMAAEHRPAALPKREPAQMEIVSPPMEIAPIPVPSPSVAILSSPSPSPASTTKSLRLDLGLGVSQIQYVESTPSGEFKISEIGVTAKAGASYSISDQWEVLGSGFVTAIPVKLSSSPTALDAARFYGLNGRVSRRVLSPSAQAQIYLSAGWYYWGMLQATAADPANEYGVAGLNGPQVLLSGRFVTDTGRHFSVYTKYALIQGAEGFVAANNELSIGGAYQLSSPRTDQSRIWSVTLDLARARHPPFTLTSVSLGLSLSY